MKSNLAKARQSSKKARLSAARLAAAQAVYQMLANEQDAASLIAEYKARRFGKPVDGAEMVLPDGKLFVDVVQGVENRRGDLEDILKSAAGETKSGVRELLLQAILLCGSYELLAHHDTDAPIIISDYLHVTHAFYDQGESKLVNGLLDKVKGAVRDSGDSV